VVLQWLPQALLAVLVNISKPKRYSVPQAFSAVLDSTAYHRIPDHYLDFQALPPDHGSLVTYPA
jgi:hypothetical protein